MPSISVLFLLIALALASMAAREYFKHQKNLPLRGKIWLRIAVIFAVVSAYLFWRS